MHRILAVETERLLHLGSVLTGLQAVPPAGRASNGMRTQGLALPGTQGLTALGCFTSQAVQLHCNAAGHSSRREDLDCKCHPLFDAWS